MDVADLRRYTATFSIALVVTIVAVLLLIYVTGANVSGIVGWLELLVAAFFTGMTFVKHKNRLPTKEERRVLLWASFTASFLVIAVPIASFLAYLGWKNGWDDLMLGLSQLAHKIPLLGWGFVVAFTAVSSYLALHLGYGFFTTRFGERAIKPSGL